MRTQAEKAAAFKALHERPGAFVIPNPWDAGSAKLLATLGFEALATTSLGLVLTLGRRQVSLAEIIANVRVIAAATDLPVTADLENGGGHDPRTAADAIRQADAAGAVGGSIEDASGDPASPIYDFGLSVERIAAAVEAARALPVPFLVTARAENLLHGRNDLGDTIHRLQAFEAAGADVLYAPGLKDLPTICTVVAALGKPFNLVMSFANPAITLPELAAAGVKRVSVGGTLARRALTSFLLAAREMRHGRFEFCREAIPAAEMMQSFEP
jgi:2-methylisocitrate lyase-like PEP mutase family enzyme